jgi:putative Ca2+/H+ antiporter (TMEM165/GDT1 family)
VDNAREIIYSIDAGLFASTFAVIFLAEIPDKTSMATLILATGSRPFAVFIGVAAAFVVQSAIAVACGSLITVLPQDIVRMSAGALFLVFAVLMWRRRAEPDDDGSGNASAVGPGFWPTAWKAFVVIFIAEWGDLTQLATATLAAKSAQPLTIFAAATLALWSVTAIAVVVGQRLKRIMNAQLMQKVAAAIFCVIGLLMLFGVGFDARAH